MTYDVIMRNTFSNTIATLTAVATATAIYGITLLLLGGIGVGDMERLPKASQPFFKFLNRTIKR
jgi:hypothetical protein